MGWRGYSGTLVSASVGPYKQCLKELVLSKEGLVMLQVAKGCLTDEFGLEIDSIQIEEG
jgi:hypothetical protein